MPSSRMPIAPRRRFWRVCALMAVVLAALALYDRAAFSAQPGRPASLRLGVPAYVFPGQAPLVTLEKLNPSPGIVILNPDNGDGPFNTVWQSQADLLRARGVMVLGYVHTDEGSRPVADTEASITNYLNSSAGAPHVSGIFLDEMSTSCSAEPYYASLYQYIHHVDPAAFVVANPGTAVNACFLSPGSMGTVFWHLVSGASSAQMPQLIALAAVRHAGYAYVTDGTLPNPWDSVASYIAAEARLMATAPPSAHGSGRGSHRAG
jgi:hypothetical protein